MLTLLLTPLQKATIQGIVNVFESGSVRGEYGLVTLLKGDKGGLTFGRSQTTLMSGNLYTLVAAYCDAPNALKAAGLRLYLDRLKRRDPSCDTDWTLKQLLRESGNDPVMRSVQDAFFDKVYWTPATAAAEKLGIQTPLGMAVVYDSFIHGSFSKIAGRTNDLYGTVRMATEKRWIAGYIERRRSWLMTCAQPLPKTVYRMDTFRDLVAAGNWQLELPLLAHGRTVSTKTLDMDSLGIGPAGWTLYLNNTALGQTWQNPEDDYRNYYPARELLEKLHGVRETGACLQYENGALEWDGQPMHVPAVLREDGKVWGQLRALAGASGLLVERDVETRTLLLTRNLDKATPLPEGGTPNA